jgi:O-antigen/teichoic acid export membrane protein
MTALILILGLIISALLGLANLLLTLDMSYIGMAASLALCTATAFIFEKLRIKFNKTVKKFVIAAELIPFLACCVCIGVVMYLSSIDYWGGQFFGGLFELLYSMFSAVSASCVLLVHLIILAAKKIKENKK